MKSFLPPKIKSAMYIVAFSLFSISSNAQYCVPATTLGCIFGDYASQFSMTGTSSSINDPSLTCSGTAGYEDRTTETCTVVSPSVVNCVVTSNNSSSTGYTTTSLGGTSPTSTNYSVELYVDWDNNSDFYGTNEDIGGASFLMASPTPFTVNIPSGIASGTYTMRMAFSSAGSPPDPCMMTVLPFPFPSFNYPTGNVIDYKITVGPTCPMPVVTLGAATCSTKVITWTAATGASGYQWTVNTTAGDPTVPGTAVPSSTLSVTATSLASGTAYYAHVRTDCGSGSFSSWVNVPFTTAGPGPIIGNAALCPSSSTTFSNAVAGGTWGSSNTTVATITSTGVLTAGTGTGNTIVSYNVGGCSTTLNVTVGTMPAITGNTTICPGSTTTLSNAVPGGTWSSSNSTVASIVGATRVVTGGSSPGTAVITYTASGCSATVTITVSSLPAITGGSNVCVGQTMPLSNTASGGTWSSSASSIASVSAAGVVNGMAVGNATITYSTGGTCFVTKTVTVGAAIAAITGTPTTFCVTGQTALSNATTGGTWSSSNSSVASVTGTVVVHGVSAGTATISYSIGSCSSTKQVIVEPNSVTISGVDTVCKGAAHAVTLTASVPGGTWTSSNTKATVDPSTGVVTGVTSSSSFTITYTVVNSCGTLTATNAMYVRANNKCTTGIDPVADESGVLNVFPNPNRGTFTLKLESDINESVQVQVTNVLGQKVKELTTVTNNMTDVNLGSVPGIYLLTASTNHGKYSVKIVVEK